MNALAHGEAPRSSGGGGGGNPSVVIPSPKSVVVDERRGSSEGGHGSTVRSSNPSTEATSPGGRTDPLASPARSAGTDGTGGMAGSVDLELSSDLDLDAAEMLSRPSRAAGAGSAGSAGAGAGAGRGGAGERDSERPSQLPQQRRAPAAVSPRGPRTGGFELASPQPSGGSGHPAATNTSKVEGFLDSDSGDWDEPDDPLDESISDAAGARGQAASAGAPSYASPFSSPSKLARGEGGDSSSGPRTKCKVAYLGGGGAPVGHGSAFSKLACANMRCTGCDFTVMRIDGKRWYAAASSSFASDPSTTTTTRRRRAQPNHTKPRVHSLKSHVPSPLSRQPNRQVGPPRLPVLAKPRPVPRQAPADAHR